MNRKQKPQKTVNEDKRTRVSQQAIPALSLRKALSIPQAITDHFGGKPTLPHQAALALNISPGSSAWRALTGAAVAYGLTEGGYNSPKIALTDLGRKLTMPTEEGQDSRARAEAALRPEICRKFFEKYDRSKFPADHIAKNVLQVEFGIPPDRAGQVLEILKDNGTFVGFIHQQKTGPFVALAFENLEPSPVVVDSIPLNGDEAQLPDANHSPASISNEDRRTHQNFKVFISHSKNIRIVEQVKTILNLYDIDFEVAIEEETTAVPVPEKILRSMRRCQAGVIVVTADSPPPASGEFEINRNVLIEIGAAFVLYDQRVVLLWDRRLKVPSNIQGLYRCEFEGEELSFADGTKLSKAIKGFKDRPA